MAAAEAEARTATKGGGDVSPSSSVKDYRCNAVVSSPRAQKAAAMMECDSPVAATRDVAMPENVAAAPEKEVAGRVLVPPEKWGQEGLLREWMDYSSFDACLAPKGLLSAREDLISQAKRVCSTVFKSQ
ncbi:PREDICTED: uncharacterized protein LOC109160279 isoform X2 [Ipomoea nil]|uniref:uncharacterized protein LOC109160279 isoform X1 n=1 Tax=Ipomoea nil TaxID=35883 RepID=UPI000900AA05|nr:PREDICTED: uncharacterized protein LOC109160279 isoform X1 [Ipomoea nil]XP_019164121.1 PREDICTED: uncharacterized protein LOC109160279 isoform X2 [Ipomoea nil]